MDDESGLEEMISLSGSIKYFKIKALLSMDFPALSPLQVESTGFSPMVFPSVIVLMMVVAVESAVLHVTSITLRSVDSAGQVIHMLVILIKPWSDSRLGHYLTSSLLHVGPDRDIQHAIKCL